MSNWVRHASLFGVVTLAVTMAFEASLSATTATVPEIDGGTLSTGMALLAAGVLIVRARRRTK